MKDKVIQIKQADDILASIEPNFKTLPKLPKGLVDFFVLIAPWLSIIFGVLLLISMVLFTLPGFVASIISLFMGTPVYAFVTLLTIAIGIAEGILMVLAFKPLQARAIAGWRMMAYSSLLGVLSGLISFVGSFNFLSIFGLVWFVFWVAVEFYLLFQMKPEYK